MDQETTVKTVRCTAKRTIHLNWEGPGLEFDVHCQSYLYDPNEPHMHKFSHMEDGVRITYAWGGNP